MDQVIAFLVAHASELIAIIALYLFGRIGISLICRVLLRRFGKGAASEKRLRTVTSLLKVVVHVALVLMVLVWVLRLFGIDPSPIFASAGIMGLAVGFGAQTLVKDFLSGMFIIVENQYAVGDIVRINGQEGEVKALGIRHTLLEDSKGNQIFIPNGSISQVVNVKE